MWCEIASIADLMVAIHSIHCQQRHLHHHLATHLGKFSDLHGKNSEKILTQCKQFVNFSHWRSMIGGGTGITSPGLSKSNGSSSSNQKRGAERLFQYFGADDSDPEDYAR